MSAPVIWTARLILRGHAVEDHPACAAMWSDPEVTRFIGGKPQSAQDAWFRILRYAGNWALLGYGFWAVTDHDGRFLGGGGFGDFHRGIAALEGAPEVGWALAPHAWGRGVASEALAAILAWGDANLSAPETRCLISDGNHASVRVAERHGFAEAV
ncbi:MAG: GNAT family N-acetyltransferase, partial [Sphingomonadaceae bacterium]|nr:GNAT family N-acetyltransferase [Sphingomonadaceae bacterium]